MRVKKDGNKIILFINKYFIKNVCFKDIKVVEDYFRKIILILRKHYNIKLEGEYEILIYSNNVYGIIIELFKVRENKKINNIIDMKMMFNINSTFIYAVNDYDYMNNLGDNIDKYYYKNKYYCTINQADDIDMSKFLEYSYIVYGDKAVKILSMAQKIK